MKIKLDGKTIETKKKVIRDLLIEKNINPEVVLVKKGDRLVPEESKLTSGDSIETIKIVSGG